MQCTSENAINTRRKKNINEINFNLDVNFFETIDEKGALEYYTEKWLQNA